jgi:hypothetical protein
MDSSYISRQELRHLQMRRRDDVGEVFEWRGKVLRAIYPESKALICYLFDCGLIEELVTKKLIPGTTISVYTIEGFAMVLEHEVITPIIYPQEWSFNMLKRASQVILQVAEIALSYGINMKDCHSLNILFDGGLAKFVDIGSFQFTPDGCRGWLPYQEFIRCYYYPLTFWSIGLEHVAKLSIFSGNLTSHVEFLLFRYTLFRCLPPSLSRVVAKYSFVFSQLCLISNEDISKKVQNSILQKAVILAKRAAAFLERLFCATNFEKLKRMVGSQRPNEVVTLWSEYHQNIERKRARFTNLVDLINTHSSDARTSIDLAGNQGHFSREVLRNTKIERAICQDNDQWAIDKGFVEAPTDLSLSFVHYDLMAPMIKMSHGVPCERLRADIAFALAVSHHIILSQKFSLEDFLYIVKSYAQKYVFIEFMPKGLWLYGAEVDVPDWYCVDWFQDGFGKYYELIHVEEIASNNIVFIGRNDV